MTVFNFLSCRYRCEKFIKGDCSCEEIVKEQIDKFRHELSDIEDIVEEDSDLDTFYSKIKKLLQFIKIIYQNVRQINSESFKNDLPELLQLIAQIKHDFQNLLLKLPKETDISDIEENLKAMELSVLYIQNLNSGNIDNILKEITDIADQLDKLFSLLDNIIRTYNIAKTDVEQVERQTNTIKRDFIEINKNFKVTLDKSKKLASDSRNAHTTALENKKIVENITFPTYNPNKTESVIVPAFNDTYEESMTDQFKRTKDQQESVNEAYKKLNNHIKETKAMLRENEEDVERLKIEINKIDELVNQLISETEEILRIQDLNDSNEDDLKILQNELQHLAEKLRVFTDQARALDRFVEDNNEMLEVSGIKLFCKTY